MKKHTYNIRLIKFAKHLEKLNEHERHGDCEPIYFCDVSKPDDQHVVLVPTWLVEELYKVFPGDWEYDPVFNEFMLKGIEDTAVSEAGIFDYFDMTDREFTLAFAIKREVDHFPKQIAEKIRQVVAIRLSSIS